MAENNQGNKYAYLDQLSTPVLQNILRADIESPESGDDEAIFYILEVMRRRGQKTPLDSCPDLDQSWSDFQSIYNTPEGEGRSLYPEDPVSVHPSPLVKSKRPHRAARKLLLVAVLLVLLTVLMTVPAFGNSSILEMIGRWTEEQFVFQPSDSETDSAAEDVDPLESSTGEALRTALREHGIYADVVPHWLPDGFQLDGEIFVSEFGPSKSIAFSANYVFDEYYFIININDHIGDDLYRSYEKITSSPDFYTTENIQHYIFTNTSSITVTWSVDSLECSVITNQPDEIIKVIDSIYEE